jgi:Arc/MetJ family transcription regulator
MKMTIDIDESALKHFMSVIGIKTKREAVNEAIRLADRIARKKKLFAESMSAEQLKKSFDPGYNLKKLRESDVPY